MSISTRYQRSYAHGLDGNNMVTIIVLASAGVILFVSLYLALCRNYDDGVVGHVALGGMSMASAAPLYEAAAGVDYDFVPTTALMYAAVAIFMARHLYRFRKYRKTGDGEWRNDEHRVT